MFLSFSSASSFNSAKLIQSWALFMGTDTFWKEISAVGPRWSVPHSVNWALHVYGFKLTLNPEYPEGICNLMNPIFTDHAVFKAARIFFCAERCKTESAHELHSRSGSYDLTQLPSSGNGTWFAWRTCQSGFTIFIRRTTGIVRYLAFQSASEWLLERVQCTVYTDTYNSACFVSLEKGYGARSRLPEPRKGEMSQVMHTKMWFRMKSTQYRLRGLVYKVILRRSPTSVEANYWMFSRYGIRSAIISLQVGLDQIQMQPKEFTSN